MLKKKISSDKINVSKNAPFFLSQAPTHHRFTFNSQFLCELKYMANRSKTVYEIFYFRFCYVFINFLYIFVQQKAWTL